jgi:hypothetical protein
MRTALALAFALSAHAARAADPDLRPYYPKESFAVVSVDVKRIAASPFGKKVFGTDEQFTAALKLAVLLAAPTDGEGEAPSPELKKAVGSVVNKIERVTTVVAFKDPKASFDVRVVTFVEGAVTEDEYTIAFEALAKEWGGLQTEKRDGRRWFGLSEPLGLREFSGVLAQKGLFLIGEREDLVRVLDVISGKAKPAENKDLSAAVARVKPDETPAYLIVAGPTFGTGLVTLSFKGDAELSGKYEGDFAELVETVLRNQLKNLTDGTSRRARLWTAAKVTVARKDKTVTLSGTVPAKLLAEEYAKLK